MKVFTILVLLFALYGCNSDRNDSIEKQNIERFVGKENIKYAKGFTIDKHEDYKVLTLKDAWLGDKKSFKYILYNNQKPAGYDNALFIKTPISSIACMSLTHIAFIEKLAQEKSIIAISGCNYVSSKIIQQRINDKLIKEIGQDQNINYEILVEKKPDIIMSFGIDASSNNFINKMGDLGLKVVLNSEYMEIHPLGKAEWIKFIAAFYNQDELANSIFDSIENSYLDLLSLTKNIEYKPSVFTGMPWNGSWHVPGAKSFQAQLFKDAGADYLWKDGNESESSLVKSKEIIIDKAIDADFWINLNSYRNISSIIAYDQKFSAFKAVKDQNLYNNDKRLNSNSGNDYWETGVVNPHVVLRDLIKIFHPELINQDFYYYKRLDK